MTFSESQKKEVRAKSAYACCVCRQMTTSVEVHHIVPQQEDGPDTIENAAPLCPTHHADLGANPEKRTRIREMRDAWYETVSLMYKPVDFSFAQSLDQRISDIGHNLPRIKEDLKDYMDRKIAEITPQNAVMAVSSILSTAVASVAPAGVTTLRKNLDFRNHAYWAEGDREPYCSRCWETEKLQIHLHPWGNPARYSCPNCKSTVTAKPELDSPSSIHVYRPPRQNPGR
ncbi:HNH endonuclease [Candidatus Kaiserbacteria bacterium]|nr:HNH endonuclease [Candidatus Kaiserbacteria bacterium]